MIHSVQLSKQYRVTYGKWFILVTIKQTNWVVELKGTKLIYYKYTLI